MAPKKKNNKGGDDWESELGETVAPVAAAVNDAPATDTADPIEDNGGGGLMAAMKRRKAKKNKVAEQDENTDSNVLSTPAEEPVNLSSKAPEEANLDDEFALPDTKSKSNKGIEITDTPGTIEEAAEGDEDRGVDGKILTKKEKEKLKKELEKKRKMENVSHSIQLCSVT
jgi:translation initiation factor 5B